MIRSTVAAIFVSVALGAAEIPEGVPAALRPLAPLAGGSWIATFPNGKITDEQRFEWVYGGKFLRNEHWVRNETGEVVYEGETIYAWDPLTEQIVWWYWNATGGHVTGTMAQTDEGWIAEGVNHAPRGQTPRVRGAFRNITSDSWESVQYFDREGEWVEQWTMVYRPVGKESAPAESALFIVHFSTGPAWLADKPFAEQPHAGEHSANLKRLREAGTLLLGARYGDYGMIVIRAASEEVARAAIGRDPAVEAGVFRYDLAPFRPFYPGCIP